MKGGGETISCLLREDTVFSGQTAKSHLDLGGGRYLEFSGPTTKKLPT